MYQFIALYGQPKDTDAFDRHYQEVHIPIIKKIPNARGYTIVKGDPGLGGEAPAYYQVATLYMDSQEALMGLLSSPEGQTVSADVLNFATGGVTFLLGTEEDAIPVQ